MTKLNYKSRLHTNAVVRLTDGMILGPNNPEEWAEYQAWLKKGNKPEEPEPLPESLPEPTVQEKLQRVGLTIDELKEALGLQ
jgi:hypothetical protein